LQAFAKSRIPPERRATSRREKNVILIFVADVSASPDDFGQRLMAGQGSSWPNSSGRK